MPIELIPVDAGAMRKVPSFRSLTINQSHDGKFRVDVVYSIDLQDANGNSVADLGMSLSSFAHEEVVSNPAFGACYPIIKDMARAGLLKVNPEFKA